MSKTPKPSASTQDHLDVEDIRDDLVILKTGWVALVMSTTAVNFDLLSEAEQDATIYAYGAFLNSLSFPVETLIRSKKADITAYFQTLEEAEASQPNPDLKRQIQKYEDFIQATVQQKTVLDKKFYLIINYSPLESGFKSKGSSMSAKGKGQLIETARAALAPKRDHVIKQTARLGLLTRQLNTQELIELFYDIYNPAPTGTQRVLLDNASYTTPIVEPAIENPAAAPVAVAPQAPTPVSTSVGSVAPGGNLSNLRPVPTQQVFQQNPAPAPASAAPYVAPVPPPPVMPIIAEPVQSFGETQSAPFASPPPAAVTVPQPQVNPTAVDPSQAQALAGLQEAAARAAQLLNSTPTAVPTAAPVPTPAAVPASAEAQTQPTSPYTQPGGGWGNNNGGQGAL